MTGPATITATQQRSVGAFAREARTASGFNRTLSNTRVAPRMSDRTVAAVDPRDVGTAAGLFADIFSTAMADGIDTFTRC